MDKSAKEPGGLPGAPTFEYRDSVLCCEEIPVERIYRALGPCYVYSEERLIANARRLLKAFSRSKSLICYSVKANSNPALFRLFHAFGLGLEASTASEFQMALDSGADASQIIIGGNARTDSELRQIAASGAFLVSVDSDEEVMRLEEAAARLRYEGRLQAPVRAALRVNPNIDARVHRHIATGLADSKFGLPAERSLEWFLHPERTPHLEWTGVHVHIGSQILHTEPLIDTLREISDFVDLARRGGAPVNVLNIGGGLGVDYTGKGGLAVERYADAACLVANNLGMKLVLEPGRFLVADACVLVGKVLYFKRTRKSFMVTELSMTDLLRPAFYGSHHEIVPVLQSHLPPGDAGEVVDVVGPVCESADILAKDRRVPSLPPGSLIGVTGAGAYGYTMASNYNGRGRLPEVLIHGSRARLIRRGESWKDLVALAGDEEIDLSTAALERETDSSLPPLPHARKADPVAESPPVLVASGTGGAVAAGSIAAGVAEGLRRRRKGVAPVSKRTTPARGSSRSKSTKSTRTNKKGARKTKQR